MSGPASEFDPKESFEHLMERFRDCDEGDFAYATRMFADPRFVRQAIALTPKIHATELDYDGVRTNPADVAKWAATLTAIKRHIQPHSGDILPPEEFRQKLGLFSETDIHKEAADIYNEMECKYQNLRCELVPHKNQRN